MCSFIEDSISFRHLLNRLGYKTENNKTIRLKIHRLRLEYLDRHFAEDLKEVNKKGMEPTNLPMEMHMLVNSKQIHFTEKELSLTILEENMKENLLKVYIMDREPSHFQMEEKIVGHGKMAC